MLAAVENKSAIQMPSMILSNILDRAFTKKATEREPKMERTQEVISNEKMTRYCVSDATTKLVFEPSSFMRSVVCLRHDLGFKISMPSTEYTARR